MLLRPIVLAGNSLLKEPKNLQTFIYTLTSNINLESQVQVSHFCLIV
jgi:hypothetical protein